MALSVQGSADTVEEVLSNRKNVFPGLLDQLRQERELIIQVRI